jgi:glucose-induced degradation protein 8
MAQASCDQFLIYGTPGAVCLQILEEHAELTFHLQQQRLIELIRAGDADAALAFAQDILAPLGEEHPAFLSELGT